MLQDLHRSLGWKKAWIPWKMLFSIFLDITVLGLGLITGSNGNFEDNVLLIRQPKYKISSIITRLLKVYFPGV